VQGAVCEIRKGRCWPCWQRQKERERLLGLPTHRLHSKLPSISRWNSEVHAKRALHCRCGNERFVVSRHVGARDFALRTLAALNDSTLESPHANKRLAGVPESSSRFAQPRRLSQNLSESRPADSRLVLAVLTSAAQRIFTARIRCDMCHLLRCMEALNIHPSLHLPRSLPASDACADGCASTQNL
jgi:hypothetical protein